MGHRLHTESLESFVASLLAHEISALFIGRVVV